MADGGDDVGRPTVVGMPAETPGRAPAARELQLIMKVADSPDVPELSPPRRVVVLRVNPTLRRAPGRSPNTPSDAGPR